MIRTRVPSGRLRRFTGIAGMVNTPPGDGHHPALYLAEPPPATRWPKPLRLGRRRRLPHRAALPLPVFARLADNVGRRVGTVTDLWMQGVRIHARGTLLLPDDEAACPVTGPADESWSRALRLGLPTSAAVRVQANEPGPAPAGAGFDIRGHTVFTRWRITALIVNAPAVWPQCLIHISKGPHTWT